MPGTPLGDVKLIGYILPAKKVIQAEDADFDSNEEEEEEEERQPEFLDMNEMDSVSSGEFNLFNSSIPGKNEVDFQAFSGRKYRVEGRFALRDPWWEVTCIARGCKKLLFMQGYPSYKLRSDLNRADWRPIVSLFLTACGVTPEFITQLFEWLPDDRDVGFSNLLEVVAEFGDLTQNTAVAHEITSKVHSSVAGRRVQAASLYPLVMSFLPKLLPAHFTDLFGKAKTMRQPATQAPRGTQDPLPMEELNHTFLSKLEEIIRTDVWKLGFSDVMFNELNLVRCEAKLKDFHECGLLRKIPSPQRNALHVYNQLKDCCYRTGSTYMELQALCKELARSIRLADEQVWDAVQLLKELGVVERERKKVAIRNLFSYETSIANSLRALVEGVPWRIPLDAGEVLRAAAEERIRGKKGGVGDVVDPEGGGRSGADQANKMRGAPADKDPARLNLVAAACEPSSDRSRSAQTDAEPDKASTEKDPGPSGSDQDRVGVQLDPDQVRAAEMICANPVTVISGKGGCGKTTVVSLVFKAAIEQLKEEVRNACRDFENDYGGPEIWGNPILGEEKEEADGTSVSGLEEEFLLTAPTGRAAALLTKKTCFSAYTLHQVVWSYMSAEKDEHGSPKNWRFKSVRVLVVDEGSLVCVQLLNSVLSMLTSHARLQKFIILGDVRQLPSIQPGNALHDLFHSLRQNNWAIEMKTNHRAESELIVQNAGLISDMGMTRCFSDPKFDAILDLSKASTMPSADKSFILVLLPIDYDLYAAITYLLPAAPGLQNDTTSQFIAFRRKDCAMINDICCKHYSNHLSKDHRRRAVFQPGDKVCCTKNGYITVLDKERLSAVEDKLRLCNGEIFFISQDVTKTEDEGKRRRTIRYLTLDDHDGRTLTASYRELQSKCRLQHAWARTIHTFQGSETENVVYVLGNGSVQTWKHVYTAVTRGQKRVYVMATWDAMASAVTRRIVTRNTRLEGLVKGMLAKPPAEGQDSTGQSGSSQPGTPLRAAPGFGSAPPTPLSPPIPLSPSTPQSSPTPSSPRAPSAQSTPFQPRCLWKAAADMSIPVEKQETEEDITSDASRADNEQLGSASAPLPTGSPVSKRTLGSPDCATPKKQPKVEPSDSPLGCSRLQLLSVSSPNAKAPRDAPSHRPSVRQPVFTPLLDDHD